MGQLNISYRQFAHGQVFGDIAPYTLARIRAGIIPQLLTATTDCHDRFHGFSFHITHPSHHLTLHPRHQET
jgi:hypothetical protein